MCGRYSLTRRQAELIERWAVEELLCEQEELQPRFNIAPSQMVPIILDQEGKRTMTTVKWGLIPFWAKNLAKTKPVINARAETAAEKPFFRQAVKKKRCLIPADGFYEWKHQNKAKVPMYIHLPDRSLFAFAGLYDEWRSPEGEVLRTCTILTTVANEAMSAVHERMPVIVRPEHEALWLNPETTDFAALEPVLEPLENEKIAMYQVSPKVNSAAQDMPEMVEPVPMQGNLFQQLQ